MHILFSEVPEYLHNSDHYRNIEENLNDDENPEIDVGEYPPPNDPYVDNFVKFCDMFFVYDRFVGAEYDESFLNFMNGNRRRVKYFLNSIKNEYIQAKILLLEIKDEIIYYFLVLRGILKTILIKNNDDSVKIKLNLTKEESSEIKINLTEFLEKYPTYIEKYMKNEALGVYNYTELYQNSTIYEIDGVNLIHIYWTFWRDYEEQYETDGIKILLNIETTSSSYSTVLNEDKRKKLLNELRKI